MKINTFVNELKGKSVEELNEELVAAKKELFNLRFQNATNQLDNTSRIKEVRRNIDEMNVSELMDAVKKCMTYKMEINDYLDMIAIWYRDVLIYKATKNVDRVVFSDQLRYIKARASKSSYEGIENILDAIEKAKARLKANVNFELTMELLLLTIKEN